MTLERADAAVRPDRRVGAPTYPSLEAIRGPGRPGRGRGRRGDPLDDRNTAADKPCGLEDADALAAEFLDALFDPLADLWQADRPAATR